MSFGANEFKDGLTLSGADGKFVTRSTSWTGLRFMIAEVGLVWWERTSIHLDRHNGLC